MTTIEAEHWAGYHYNVTDDCGLCDRQVEQMSMVPPHSFKPRRIFSRQCGHCGGTRQTHPREYWSHS